MRIPLILQQLDEILKLSNESREQALALFGTAEHLLDFLELVVKVHGLHDAVGINTRIRDIHYALCIMAGLDELHSPGFQYLHFARQAVSTLHMTTLLGEKPELMQRRLSRKGELLAD